MAQPTANNPIFHHDDTDFFDAVGAILSLPPITVRVIVPETESVATDVPDSAYSLAPAGYTKIQQAPECPSAGYTDCDEELFRLVCRGWGQGEASGAKKLVGRLLLCDVSPSDASSASFRTSFMKLLEKSSCEIVRWNGSLVLLSFNSEDSIHRFCSDIPIPVKSLVTAVETESTLPCFVHIISPAASYTELVKDIHDALLAPFGGDMFLHVTKQSTTSPSEVKDQQPRIIIQLRLSMRHSKTPSRHQLMSAELAKANWAKIDRDAHKLENTQLYQHKSSPSLAFGVHLSSTDLTSGIRFILTVSSPEKFDATRAFYDDLLQHQSTVFNDDKIQTSIHPLSKFSELIIRSDADADLQSPNTSATLCFRPKTVSSSITGLSDESLSGWRQCTDTDGNTVNLSTPLC